MAELNQDYGVLTGSAPPQENQPLGTWGDFAKTAGAATLGVGEDLAALAQHTFEAGGSEENANISSGFRKIFGATKDQIEESINPETRKLAASAFSSPEFWDHPFLAGSLKLTGMTPAMAAMAIPGGLLADTIAATMAASAAGGVINAGTGLSEFYKQLDKMPDSDLQEQSPLYKQIREEHDEGDARKLFARQAQGWAPAINGLIGAGVGAIGPAGTAARALAGGAERAVAGAGERGALGAAGVGALEGGVGGAVQGGATDAVNQQAMVDAGLQKDVDYGRSGAAALEGGVLGGVAGGALGGVLHRRSGVADTVAEEATAAKGSTGTSSVAGKATTAEASSTVPSRPPHELEGVDPQAAGDTTGRTGTPAKPVGSETYGPPELQGPKQPYGPPELQGPRAPRAVGGIEPTAAQAPDAAQAAAIAAATPAPKGAVGGVDLEALNKGVAAAQQSASPPAAVPPASAAAAPVPPAQPSQPPGTQRGAGVGLPREVTAPEQPATLRAQEAQAQTPPPAGAEPSAVRKGVLYPGGEGAPKKPPAGMNKLTVGGDVVHYDKKQITVAEIRKAARAKRLNEVLGLGPVSKDEALARAAQGETPVAVTERTPDGTEVKGAAGTDATAPAQVASLESGKTPGNVVRVETPENVIQMRAAPPGPKAFVEGQDVAVSPTAPKVVKLNRGQQIKAKRAEEKRVAAEADAKAADEAARKAAAKTLPVEGDLDLSGKPKAEPAVLTPKENVADAEKKLKRQEEGGPGKNLRGKAGEKVREQISKAENIVSKHEPHPVEGDFLASEVSEGAIIARAQRMLDAAKAEGVKIPEQIKPSAKGNTPSDSPAVVILNEAQRLIDAVSRTHISLRDRVEAVQTFWERDGSLRKGKLEEIIAERRAEGEMMKRGGGEVNVETLGGAKEDVRAEIGHERDVRNEKIVGKDDVTTSAAPSAKGRVRGVEAQEEVREVRSSTGKTEEETVAAAASGDKLAADAERKKQLMAEMQAKYGKPGAPPTKSGSKISEALRVEKNPSAAQIEAGNYKKGHRTVDGIRLTLENLKGGIRRGVTALGEKWQAKMGADYGYIKKTRGADGDQIDAYDGKRGKKHFIIDQLDANTGAFDEHKVMLRFRNEAEARKAYEDSFSDGKGAQRIGNVHEVSADELKAWLKSGDGDISHTEHVIDRDLSLPNFDMPKGRVTKARDVLNELDFSKLEGVPKALAPFFKGRLEKLAGNVDVEFVSAERMRELSPNEPNAIGLHIHDTDTTVPSRIYVRDDVPKGMGLGQLGHVVLHEATHAITVREMNANPKFEGLVDKLRNEFANRYGENSEALDRVHRSALDYGMWSPKEFIAEAFSNPHVQEVLAQMPISRSLAREIGLDRSGNSMWDALRFMVKRAVAKLTGELPKGDTLMDGIMRVGQHITDAHESGHFAAREAARALNERGRIPERREPRFDTPEGRVRSEALRATGDVTRQVTDYLERDRGPRAMVLRTFDNIAQAADRYFGENNPVRKIHSAIEATRVAADRYYAEGAPILKSLVELRAKFPEQFKEFNSLLHDATVANVRPEVGLDQNGHLGKNVLKHTWNKAQHKELSERYDALPDAFKKAWKETTTHFRDTQNKMTLGIIENRVLKLLGHDDEGLARRVHEDTLTDADKQLLGDNLEIIQKAGELAKIEGTYVPLMRRGDHVVRGSVKLEKPANAKQIDGNTFEFGTRAEAEAYAKKNDLKTDLKKVWVDEKTGELHSVDLDDPAQMRRVQATDINAEAKYRATVQNQHVEFVQGRGAAEKRAKELAAQGGMDMQGVVPRRYEPSGREAADLSGAMSGLLRKLENSPAYKEATPYQQLQLRAALNEAALAAHGSTRVSSRAMPRRGVKGYDENIIQNMSEYNTSTGNYLAKLDHAPQLEKGLKDMREAIKQDESKAGVYGRQAIANEVEKRVNGDNGFQQGGKFSPAVNRIMSVSFMDKLASPAYSMINAMQPTMVTMPYLTGRHGLLRSVSALGKAYSDLSALHIFKQGIKATGRRLKGDTTPDDFISDAKARLKSPGERAMIDELVRTGEVDPSAGMEIKELVKDRSGLTGKLDTGLGYMEGVAREMPRAVEAVNRLTSALAAYRLEVSRGVPHEKAVQYAKDTVNNTQFNYSPTNAPKIFNHPVAKIALQFKKYGQGMYQLIGSEIGKAYRNESPGDRAQAVKTLITLAATHTAMAGALGLPTEPFKYLVMGANAAGLTSATWGDVENKIRTEAASMLGKTGGEVLTRGLPRLLNLDLSRMGLDSISSFGEPRSMKEGDVKKWLFDTLSGPVVALGGDYVKGAQALSNGDFAKAAENMIPIKAFSDSLRAYRQASEGKKSAAGRETLSAYTPGETAARVLGFGSGREAETGAARSAYYSASNAQKEERSSLINSWAQASGSSKTKAMSEITKWNKGRPDEARIKPKDLTAKLKADKKAEDEGVLGIVASKQTKHLVPEGVYSTGN